MGTCLIPVAKQEMVDLPQKTDELQKSDKGLMSLWSDLLTYFNGMNIRALYIHYLNI